jgi:serine acetyltransferase
MRDQPPGKAGAEAQRATVAKLARRTAQRSDSPLQAMRNPATTHLLLFFCRRRVPVLSAWVRMLFNSDIQCRLPADIHLPHPYGIVIHPQAVIGHRVILMQQVMIGGKDSSENIAPVIGDDVRIGAGARVLGDVRIGNGVVIGANAVITRDIPPGVTVVGANRIVPGARPATVSAGNDPAIARFPVGAQRHSRSQTRGPL